MLYPYNSILARLVSSLKWLVEKARRAIVENRSNIPLLARLSAHLGIIALVIFGLLMSGVEIRAAGADIVSVADPPGGLAPLGSGFQQENSGSLVPYLSPLTSRSPIQNQAPDSTPQQGRTQVVQYTVSPGDTVTGIASHFHVSADSVLWANAKLEDNPDMLSIGQNLNIPPTTGVLYTVQPGDTVEAIANRFKAKAQDIYGDIFNQEHHDFKSNPPKLTASEFVMVPGGSKPFVASKSIISGVAPQAAPRGTTNFITPVSACLSQIFWARHSGVDLAAPIGTPVYAADSGYIAVVGWDNTGYGNMILLNHGNGYMTRYGHLSAFNVEPGQAVKKGALIGRVGSTGHSTGPHLHFEIILNGAFKNPAYYIKLPGRCYGY
ncbi:MAG: peptidoglycan DD-metalloendopeptidase family protein [Anaerolineae bacterium]